MKITIDNIPPEKVNVIVHLLNDVLSNVSAGSKIEVSEAVPDVADCKHDNEIMRQGDGFVYSTCGDCGDELN
jgi:hypothetical protein